MRALNARINRLPSLPGQVVSEVDGYLASLKQGLGITTKRMIANLPLADRQALEYGAVELFTLREQIDGCPHWTRHPRKSKRDEGAKAR